MSWVVVARKDFRDARLSRALWGVTGLFVLLSVGFALLYATFPEVRGDIESVSTLGFLTLLLAATSLFVSIAAIVVAAGAIARERDSGSSKLLLGFPHSRLDVVLGKLVGRTAVLAVALLVGLALTLVVVLTLFDSFSPVDYTVFTLVTLLLVLVYVCIMIALSAMTASGGRAMAYGIGAFVALELLSDLLPTLALFVTNGFSLTTTGPLPSWIAFLSVSTPTAAYTNALMWFLGDGTAVELAFEGALGGSAPFYLTGWASLVVLGLWLVVPLSLGYWRFARSDL
jgi:ABC-2 type transport system permease protein